jgi:hypothetical protein
MINNHAAGTRAATIAGRNILKAAIKIAARIPPNFFYSKETGRA